MTVQVQVHSRGPATVVKIAGVGCGDLLGLVAEGLRGVAEDCRLLVVDLDDTTLSDAAHLEALVRTLADVEADVRIVCSRLSARRLLRARRSGMCPPVVATLAEALGEKLRPPSPPRPHQAAAPA
jgi:hypothetical protein